MLMLLLIRKCCVGLPILPLTISDQLALCRMSGAVAIAL